MSHPTDDTPNPVSDPSWSASDPEPVAAPSEATPTPGFEVEEQAPGDVKIPLSRRSFQ